MQIFLSLLIKIISLYVLILLGFIAGKKLNVKKESIASVLIYIVTPVVIFNSIVSTKITPELLLLPLIFFFCCSFMCLLFYVIGKSLFNNNTKNLLAFAAGTANTGYFGIPVAVGHKVMFLLSIVPLAANLVAFSTELKAQPEKASLAVFVSTLIALIYIPLLTTLLLS